MKKNSGHNSHKDSKKGSYVVNLRKQIEQIRIELSMFEKLCDIALSRGVTMDKIQLTFDSLKQIEKLILGWGKHIHDERSNYEETEEGWPLGKPPGLN